MPKKVATIRFGTLDVEVPQFTLGQLERIAEWLSDNQGEEVRKLGDIVRSYRALLGIAFERSSPKYSVEQIDELEMDVVELRQAGSALLQLAGLQAAEGPVDPEVAAPEGASPTTSTGSLLNSLPDAATRPN